MELLIITLAVSAIALLGQLRDSTEFGAPVARA